MTFWIFKVALKNWGWLEIISKVTDSPISGESYVANNWLSGIKDQVKTYSSESPSNNVWWLRFREVSDEHDNSIKSSDNSGSIKSTFTNMRVSKLTTHPPIGSVYVSDHK